MIGTLISIHRMIQSLKRFNQILVSIGINFIQLYNSLKNSPILIRDYFSFKKQIKGNDQFQFRFSFPILNDYNENAGLVGGHYFYQDLFVAQKIFEATPEVHVDVGSRIDGFVSHVASFREIKVFDIRPMDKKIKNISFIQKDIMNDGPELNDICDSISVCML